MGLALVGGAKSALLPVAVRDRLEMQQYAVHGASVHFVTGELDGGPVFAQAEMPILPDDTPEALARRLLPLEHRLLVASVDLVARARIVLGNAGVELDGAPLAAPLRLQIDGSLRTA